MVKIIGGRPGTGDGVRADDSLADGDLLAWDEATNMVITGTGGEGSFDAGELATVMFAATGKTTPVDADTLAITDSAASNGLKKLTWANLKATAKTYFDTLYATISHTHTAANVTDFTTAARATLETYSDQRNYVTSLDEYADALSAGTWPVAGTAIYGHFRVSEKITWAVMRFNVEVQSGNMDAVICTWDGTTMTEVASSGSMAVPSIGYGTATFTTPYECSPGVDYYMGMVVDNTTASFRRATSGLGASPIFITKRHLAKVGVNVPHPATVTTFVAPASTYMPYMALMTV